MNKLILCSLILLPIIGTSSASASTTGSPTLDTIYVHDFGDTGLQTFNYIFNTDFNGSVILGVSDQFDDQVYSFLDLLNPYNISLITDPYDLENEDTKPVDTSSYLNTLGEPGVSGELYSFQTNAAAGDSLSFDWHFYTDEELYEGIIGHDFAFISLVDNNSNSIYYHVLAEVRPVPIPIAAWLFGSSLIGMTALRRKPKTTQELKA